MLSTNVSRYCKAMGELGHVVVIESSQVDGVDASCLRGLVSTVSMTARPTHGYWRFSLALARIWRSSARSKSDKVP